MAVQREDRAVFQESEVLAAGDAAGAECAVNPEATRRVSCVAQRASAARGARAAHSERGGVV